MFKEASKGRGIVHAKQREAPLTLDEVAAAVRGRYKWNIEEKKWEVGYRSMRDYWIILLLTVSERLFALPVPKIVPCKILAQFELEKEQSQLMMSTTKKEGIDSKYLSIKEKRAPIFQRDTDKKEANIRPEAESSVKYQRKK